MGDRPPGEQTASVYFAPTSANSASYSTRTENDYDDDAVQMERKSSFYNVHKLAGKTA